MRPLRTHPVAVGLAMTAIAACGGSAPASSRSGPTGSSSAGPTASASASPASGLDPPYYPEANTPIKTASPQLQQAWAPYDVTIIPGRHTLDALPTGTTVVNQTKGALTDSQARAIVAGFMRTEGFVGWMETNVQPGLNDHIRAHATFNGPIGDAVRAGKAVTNPPCDIYPVALAVTPVTADVTAFIAGRGYDTTAATYALVQQYSGPCAVTVAGAQPLFSFSGKSIGLSLGHLQHDPVLGDLWFEDGARGCPSGDPAAPPECNALP